MTQWAEPQEGDRFSAKEAQNRRLIVVPTEYVPQIRTSRGDTVDAIRVNVVDLQADGGPREYMGALWFGGRLIRSFKTSLGKLFCGYVYETQAAGGYPAWEFRSLTQDQQTMAMANTYLTQHPEFLQTCEGDMRIAQGQAPDPWAGAMPTPPAQPQAPALPPPPPAPAQPQVPQGWGQQQAPPPPPPPVPGPPAPAPTSGSGLPPVEQGSVMDRLRAQREQGYNRPREQSEGPPPF